LGSAVNGIHHITVLASDPQQNLLFYTRVLGLRLVKRTVNFDAPDVYHLYYGDESGAPGTLVTFFPFPDAAPGMRGSGEISAISFAVPKDSIGFWAEHLSASGLSFDGPTLRFGASVIGFTDPDALRIELLFNDVSSASSHWSGSRIPAEHAIRKLYGATLMSHSQSATDGLLRETLGFRPEGEEGGRSRYSSGFGTGESWIDLIDGSGQPRARQSAGSVHHIAWRVPNEDEQNGWREAISRAGLYVTPVRDRKYFHSIYFREPGGILFEIATDGPGFAIDEPEADLGSHLQLPPWLEPERSKLERSLPQLTF